MKDGSIIYGNMSTSFNIANMQSKGREGEVYNIDPVLEYTSTTKRHLANRGVNESKRLWTNQQSLEQEERLA